MAEEKIAVVKSFPNRHFAQVAKGLLDSCGIKSFITADDAGGAYPPLSSTVELKVKEEDMEKAKMILEGSFLKEG